MSVSSRALIELVFLGPTNNRRQLQDSPVLGDVWIAFASKPAEPMDLLITPNKDRSAGRVASLISHRIIDLHEKREADQEADVAYLQGFVAARLFFREVIHILLPFTEWWWNRKTQDERRSFDINKLRQKIGAVVKWAQAKNEDARAEIAKEFSNLTPWDRYIAIAGIISWGVKQSKKEKVGTSTKGIVELITRIKDPDKINEIMAEVQILLEETQQDPSQKDVQIWRVSLNRKALPALEKSVPAVKGDAARTLFKVSCEGITWAVLDSGIDATHPVFKDKQGKRRVIKAFDFSNIRKVVSLDNKNVKPFEIEKRLGERWSYRNQRKLSDEDAMTILKNLAEDADNDRPIDWESVEKLIEIDPETPPPMDHGTHVAGIIGAYDGSDSTQADDDESAQFANGMCPDIKLYDFRVLANSLQDTEFAIIAALQYIRFLNERHTYITIHGANLSLSIPHDVRNFACGCTPVCDECERLVESGVVVVAAAGNLGYQSFETREGSYEGYTAFSITDPGNAESVITVGATHRYKPHTYGVSYFSSRGPTGDGRMKPDLVAPGERIESSLPKGGWGELDGTSMAAPHVSGAAAMLMSRYVELIGEPRKIKSILCESATDLGRERNFQGHGMLDVLRAFQKL
jgi:serine protease AprX